MSLAFGATYEAVDAFSRRYAQRIPAADFRKTILLRRIGSSTMAGLETAQHLLGRLQTLLVPEDEAGDENILITVLPPDPQEIQFLREIERTWRPYRRVRM